jgi:hypothetical protein
VLHCGPSKALLAPLFAPLDAVPAAMSGDLGLCSLAAARGRLPAYLGRMRYGRLIASCDDVRCLECVLEEVAMLALVRTSCVVLGMHARGPLVSMAVVLRLNMLALLPQGGLG